MILLSINIIIMCIIEEAKWKYDVKNNIIMWWSMCMY